MAFKDTIRVVQSGQRRIKIFVDFWNVVINARSQCKDFDIHVHWDRLVSTLVHETKQGYFDETTGELAGCYIFGSKAQSNAQQSAFVQQVLDRYGSESGLFFNFSERIPKETSAKCSQCNEPVRVNSESGVDVLLTVEMIKHGIMREHEYLALVSSDRDFIPLLSFLKDQGQRVLHVAAGKPEREMRAITWAQVGLLESYPFLCTIEHNDCIILTAPPCSAELEELLGAAPVPRDQIRVIDITDKEQIHDRDLAFLMTSLGMHWKSNDGRNDSYGYAKLKASPHEFRRNVANGSVRGYLPCALENGSVQVKFTGNHHAGGWTRMIGPGGDNDGNWSKLFQKQ
jgi:uncharacterized LabA/DUF88 family protein